MPFNATSAFLNEEGKYRIANYYYFVTRNKVYSIFDKALANQVGFGLPKPEKNDNFYVSDRKITYLRSSGEELELRGDERSCTVKSNNNKKGSFALISRIYIEQFSQSTFAGLARVERAGAFVQGKIKRTFGWVGRGSQLNINGTIVAVTGGSITHSTNVNASRWGRDLGTSADLPGSGQPISNVNEVLNLFFSPATSVLITSDKLPSGKYCLY